jgi:serine/threonine protein kinase
MSVLFDHEIIEQLHDSSRSLVYRARAADGTALIVKLPNQPFPSFQQLAQFKREYAIARRCRHPGVVRPLALELHGGRWTMIQEDAAALHSTSCCAHGSRPARARWRWTISSTSRCNCARRWRRSTGRA